MRHSRPYFVAGTSDREHLDGEGEEACWCEPVTAYESQATGATVLVHRATNGAGVPESILAEGRRIADMPDMQNPEDFL